MAKWLQVVLQDAEYSEIRRIARECGTSISKWVRQALEDAQRRESSRDIETKLAVICVAAAHNAEPAVDLDTMLAEIEQGLCGWYKAVI
jgi:transposase-like protein